MLKNFHREETPRIVGVYLNRAEAHKESKRIEVRNGLYQSWVEGYTVKEPQV